MSTNTYYNQREYTKVGGFRKKAILKFVCKDNATILDIGCSDGEMGEILKKDKEAKVTGIDISVSIIEKAKVKLDHAYVVDIDTDISLWPDELKKEKFDYIIISEVLEHLLEPEAVLEKIKQFVHNDTEIIITVPNLLFWKNRLKIMLGKFDYEEKGLMDKGHIHIFSWDSFRRMIEQAGYKIIDINNNIPTRGTKWLGKIFVGLFTYQFAVVIKRK